MAHFLLPLTCGYFFVHGNYWNLKSIGTISTMHATFTSSKTTAVQQNEENLTKNQREREKEKRQPE